MQPRVAVFLTAYNEEPVIASVISRIDKEYSVFVVNDGSSDNTVDAARNKGAEVISHPINLGQGNAGITMFKRACSLDYDYIVHLDADGQHDPDEISKLIAKAEEDNLDVVIGSRILGTNYDNAPFLRKTFLPYYTWVINKLTGYTMTDAMSGFRAHRISSLKKVFHIFDQMLEPQYLASEMFIRFSKEGLTVGEVPIHMQDRLKGHSYKGTIRYGWGVLKAIVRTLMDINENKQETAP
ncbi:glycosyltransferase family 2 protein [Thermodesulfobacteriota bacterium]